MITVCPGEEIAPVLEAVEQAVKLGKHIVLLSGELGSGKTHLVKAFVKKSMDQEADSPTFALINSYEYQGQTIHHFDLYRLKSAEEAEDIGLWDYIDQGFPCFIEWPEKIAELLPADQVVHVDIKLTLNQCREYSVY